MSRKLKEPQEKEHPVDAEVLKVLSPYRREHINRFGDYLLDLLRSVLPLDPTIWLAWTQLAHITVLRTASEGSKTWSGLKG